MRSLRMRSCLSAIALLVTLIAKEAKCVTITDIIQNRPELKKLSAYFQGSSTSTKLSQIPNSKKYTFFAPTDSAFDIVPAHIVQTLRKSDVDAKNLINDVLLYHTVTGFGGSTVTTSVIEEEVRQKMGAKRVTNKDGSYVFFRMFEGEPYVNGARILVANLVADNGVVHIIDRLFNIPGQSDTAYGYISNIKQSTTEYWTFEFNKLVDRYKAAVTTGKLIEGSSNYFATDVLQLLPDVTVFVPSDEVITQLSPNSKNKLFNDIHMLQQVVESHVLYGGTYHASLLLKEQSVLALKGSVQTRTFNNKVNIKNDCVSANIVSSNITVTNGVVHIIDGLLGWVSSDAWTELREVSKYRKFFDHVNSGQEKVKNLLSVGTGVAAVPESERLTVFAPTNDAFKNVALTQDIPNLQKVVKMHVIKGTMDVMEMVNHTEVDTLATEDHPSNYKARFYQLGEEHFVEVDYVRAKLLDSGKCVTNGIVYQISLVLGATSELILEELQANPLLSSMYDAVMNVGLATSLMDASQTITLFVPTNAAFELMRDPSSPSTGTHTGRSILDNERNRHVLQRVIYRHMVALSMSKELFIDSSTVTKVTTLQMEFGEVTLVPHAGGFYVDYGSVRARVTTANLRMNNGVIHLIDRVLYSDDPTSSEWTGSSSSASFVFLTNALVLLTLLLFTIR